MTPRGRQPISVAEWVTLSLSALIVGALVVVAVVEEVRLQESQEIGVRMTFATDQTEARGGQFYVPYTVRNTGAAAITAAEIWIQVYDGDRLAESAEVAVEFLPLQGTQEGMYVSNHDPTTHEFVVRVESLQVP